ncbi:CDP-diacylglycerol--glycerol-3-phosphate 3-phosphatidyltransferase [Candidatus Fermentibacteria bacterium]|nr:CDP-diacylglycerol--glycerol-3-phosphate 3-phosphatidyltransferase [Candidatus Fermentibacteria bacterium]
MKLNWPNRITILRIILSPVFMMLLLDERLGFRIAALGTFTFSAMTDLYDGYIARKYGWVTNLGKFLDPLADKLLVSLALVGLVQIELVPVFAAYLIIGRELLVTGLRAIAAYAGILILSSGLGKWKATIQMVAIFFYLLLSVLQKASVDGRLYYLESASFLLLLVAVALTLFSGFVYFRRNGSILLRLLQ